MSLLLNLVAAQDDAEAVRAATELSADAAEFTLPSAPAAPAAAPAVVPAKAQQAALPMAQLLKPMLLEACMQTASPQRMA